MTSSLTLASRLAALSDNELIALLTRRSPIKPRLTDIFDLAESLLEHGSIQAALAGLDRPALVILAKLADGKSVDVSDTDIREQLVRLESLALVVLPPGWEASTGETLTQPAIYDAVRERLEHWPEEGLPSLAELATGTEPSAGEAAMAVATEQTAGATEETSETQSADPDTEAVEHAFYTIGAVTEILVELARKPARELQKGGLGVPDTKRLTDASALSATSLPGLLWLLNSAGLVNHTASTYRITERGTDWMAEPTARRHQVLAETWLKELPHGVAKLYAQNTDNWGESFHRVLRWYFPASGETVEHLATRSDALATMLGLLVGVTPSTVGISLVTDGSEAASVLLQRLLPEEVTKVYVQHDLTIVSPGPLGPSVDMRLRRFAELENRALASTFRVTAASVERAVGLGETATSIRAFLSEISLTGIPQPLDYLIDEVCSHYGLVRVTPAKEAGDNFSLVHCTDPSILASIAIDQSLSSLGLRPVDEQTLASRFDRDVVFWSLRDAKYPVAAEDSNGDIVGLRRTPVPASTTGTSTPVQELAKRLRAATTPSAEGNGQLWLSRQLETAVKAHVAVMVTVKMPDGSEREMTLEPNGVGGGRLRGLDRRADTERTLPLKSIVAVRVAD